MHRHTSVDILTNGVARFVATDTLTDTTDYCNNNNKQDPKGISCTLNKNVRLKNSQGETQIDVNSLKYMTMYHYKVTELIGEHLFRFELATGKMESESTS